MRTLIQHGTWSAIHTVYSIILHYISIQTSGTFQFPSNYHQQCHIIYHTKSLQYYSAQMLQIVSYVRQRMNIPLLPN